MITLEFLGVIYVASIFGALLCLGFLYLNNVIANADLKEQLREVKQLLADAERDCAEREAKENNRRA